MESMGVRLLVRLYYYIRFQEQFFQWEANPETMRVHQLRRSMLAPFEFLSLCKAGSSGVPASSCQGLVRLGPRLCYITLLD